MAEAWFAGDRVLVDGALAPRAIRVQDGKIRQVVERAAVPAGAELIDAGSLVVLPGLVDSHVHINDPGRAEWEGFETATRAAIAGGVTTVLDMPLNSVPSTVTLRGLSAKLRAMEGHAWCDVGLAGGLVPGNDPEITTLFREGVLAFKCFLAESGVAEFSHVAEPELARGMRILHEAGATLLVHAELPPPLAAAEAEVRELDPRRYETYLRSRPMAAEEQAVELVLRLSTTLGARAHIVHLSAASALRLLSRARDAKAPLTAETCPHYLTFAAEDIPDGATEYKCAPPIRGRENRDALWDGLREGLIAQVVTDHSPSDAAMKCSGSGDFMRAWGGISSLELGLRAVFTEARERGLGLADVSRWMSAAPARLCGIDHKKGAIKAGLDADLVFFDDAAVLEVDAAKLQHRHKITPYARRLLRGRVVRTILRGETVYHEGTFTGPRGLWQR